MKSNVCSKALDTLTQAKVIQGKFCMESFLDMQRISMLSGYAKN